MRFREQRDSDGRMPSMPPFDPDDNEALARYEGWHDCAQGRIVKDTALPAVPPQPPASNPLSRLMDQLAEKQTMKAMRRVSKLWPIEAWDAIRKESRKQAREEVLASRGRDHLNPIWNNAQQNAAKLERNWPYKDETPPDSLWKPLRLAADLSLTLPHKQAEEMAATAIAIGAAAEQLDDTMKLYRRYGTGPASQERLNRRISELQNAAKELNRLMRQTDNSLYHQFRQTADTIETAAANLDNNYQMPQMNDEGYEPEDMAALENTDADQLNATADAAATDYSTNRPQRILAIPPRWIIYYQLPALKDDHQAPGPTTVSTARQALNMDYRQAAEEIQSWEREWQKNAERLLKPMQGDFQNTPEATRKWIYENAAALSNEAKADLTTLTTFFADDAEYKRMFSAKKREIAAMTAKRLCQRIKAQDYGKAALEVGQICQLIQDARNGKTRTTTLSGLHYQAIRLRDRLETMGTRLEPERQTVLSLA